jgi:hypothetical protein
MVEIKKVSAISVVLMLSSFLLAGMLQPVVGMEEGLGQLGDIKEGVEIYNQNVDKIPFIKVGVMGVATNIYGFIQGLKR